ncbi:metallophosphoesterase family protein [Halopseudomonas pelagia]|uniref:metallophosphoesterase family protein n=1 Tax=Halopseudomonas pelagia TaxID=553151 RepID=UPI0003B3AB8B|nr:metallophosphoesterase [Halopseudomonas pelagia]|tara:strand:- start:30 stop:1964 length:1935 start_codon:yes stop_codon:yes gene_type:complete
MTLRYSCIGLLLGSSLLGGCLSSGSSSSDDAPTTPPVTPPPVAEVTSLKVGVLPDTQGGGFNTSIHPMRALLEFYREQDVDVVLVVGDLSESGTPAEYAQWRSVAEDYKNDFTLLPVQGNHDIKGTDLDWVDNVSDLVPADAMHMPGQEYKTYALVRDNVLIINISYGHMPFTYDFVRQMIETHRADVDHIIVSTHNTMVGSRYGYIREKAVEAYDTSASDQQFLQVHEDYRQLFADNDVIYIAGHEHSYTRSLISGNFGGHYTEIVSGSASYKGYDSRFGESEQIQNVVMVKVNDSGATGELDVNASILNFSGDRVDYASYFENHTITANEDGMKELASPDWKLVDRFSRTTERCDKIVFPSSIPAGNQLNMTHDKRYKTNACVSANGFEAKIIDGENNIFNRYETRTRTTDVEPGINTATSNTALAARYYRWLHIPHASYSPNLNNSQRVRLINAGTADEEVQIRETTIDLKKQLSLSWVDTFAGALSDSLIISGIQGQDGTYINARGVPKNLETDTGLPGSYGDGSELGKQPVVLPAERVNSNWILDDDARGDDYVLQFNLAANMNPEHITLGRWNAQSEQWAPVVTAECISQQSYDASYLTGLPNDVDASCAAAMGLVTVGVQHVWAKLDQDGVYALIER